MKLLHAVTLIALLGIQCSQADDNNTTDIILEDFTRANPIHYWKEINDPVMGGRSSGIFYIHNQTAVFQGNVVNIPFLCEPGFIQARTVDHTVFPDVSKCQGIVLKLRARRDNNQDQQEYSGYRFSFGNKKAPGGKMFAYGFKTTLRDLPTDNFGDIYLPFTDFTDFWDDATGDPIYSCQDNSVYCPDVYTLRNMKTMAIWAEGVQGKVSLELQSIRAVKCDKNKEEYSSSNEEEEEEEEENSVDKQGQQMKTSLHSFLGGWAHHSFAPALLVAWLMGFLFGDEDE
jgi:hypothetical protein